MIIEKVDLKDMETRKALDISRALDLLGYRRVRFVADAYQHGRIVSDTSREGWFHMWAGSPEECGETGATIQKTVAIIEDDSGGIYKVDPEKVHFIKPLKEEL